MAMENKRIIQLNTERTTPAADDYVMVDSATAGTAKYLLPKITDAIDREIRDRTSAGTALQTAITNEATARTNADTTLQGNITAEATARAAADTAINGEITQLKEDLTAEETARESADEAINATLETKADADTPIATAEQLLSDKYTVDQVPYTFRASGSSGADREYDEIVGGSIVWNQLCNGSSVTVLNGHKYYILKGGTASIGASTGSAITGLTSGTDMVSDLTQMFGTTIADYIYSLETATAGAGVAWFKKFFPKDYYAYDAGTLKHVEGLSSHDMVGFNAWDEEWELGRYDTNGVKVSSSDSIRCKNRIDVLPSTYYYFNFPDTATMNNIVFFDADGNKTGSTYAQSNRRLILTPEATRYMVFQMSDLYGTTYKNDICINLHWDGERDGEYEPYVKHSYPLDDSLTLRGIPKLDSNNQLYYDGDTYAADGTVTRKYGIVDLGTLSWTHEADSKQFYSNIFASGYSSWMYNVFCSKYIQDHRTYAVVAAPHVRGINNNRIYIIDDSYTDAASFKTAMSGVYLVYELATPTTEEAEPFINPQIVDPDGTEEYVTTSIVPVGHYTKYPANLRSAIERVMEQVPEAPSANGTYVLKVTKTSSGVTYAWVAE